MGDITIGDFWGIGSDMSFYNLKKEGISFVMLNSMKGNALFKISSSNLLFEERSIEEAIKHNVALKNKRITNHYRVLFFAMYKHSPQLALKLFTIAHRTMVWFRDQAFPVRK